MFLVAMSANTKLAAETSYQVNCLVPSCKNSDLAIGTFRKATDSGKYVCYVAFGRSSKACDESFKMYSFPENDLLRRLWIDLVQRPKDFELKPWHGICSLHFIQDDHNQVDLPFPVLNMKLRKWQIIQTLKAYFHPKQVSAYDIILNQHLGPKTNEMSSKTQIVDSEQDSEKIEKRMRSKEPNVSHSNLKDLSFFSDGDDSSITNTLMDIASRKEEPIHINVSISSVNVPSTSSAESKQEPVSIPGIRVLQGSIPSAVPGIRLLNVSRKVEQQKKVHINLESQQTPFDVVEQEVVIDKFGTQSSSTSSSANATILKRGRKATNPISRVTASEIADFDDLPVLKRPYRRKMLSSDLPHSMTCSDNFDLYQTLIEDIKSISKDVNDLKIKKKELISRIGETDVLTAVDCNQCAALEKAYNSSLVQSRRLESELGRLQAVQNTLIRKNELRKFYKDSGAANTKTATVKISFKPGVTISYKPGAKISSRTVGKVSTKTVGKIFHTVAGKIPTKAVGQSSKKAATQDSNIVDDHISIVSALGRPSDAASSKCRKIMAKSRSSKKIFD